MKKITIFVFVLVIFALLAGCQPKTIDAEETQQTVITEEATAETVEANEATIIHLTDENYHENIDTSVGLVFVDFWAAWCGPCLQLAPILEEISVEQGITIYKVDVDECPKIAAEFQITGIPMVYLYKDGEVVDSQMGSGYKQLYLDMLANHK